MILRKEFLEDRFSLSYIECFFVTWDGNFSEACFVFWIYRIMGFCKSRFPWMSEYEEKFKKGHATSCIFILWSFSLWLFSSFHSWKNLFVLLLNIHFISLSFRSLFYGFFIFIPLYWYFFFFKSVLLLCYLISVFFLFSIFFFFTFIDISNFFFQFSFFSLPSPYFYFFIFHFFSLFCLLSANH